MVISKRKILETMLDRIGNIPYNGILKDFIRSSNISGITSNYMLQITRGLYITTRVITKRLGNFGHNIYVPGNLLLVTNDNQVICFDNKRSVNLPSDKQLTHGLNLSVEKAIISKFNISHVEVTQNIVDYNVLRMEVFIHHDSIYQDINKIDYTIKEVIKSFDDKFYNDTGKYLNLFNVVRNTSNLIDLRIADRGRNINRRFLEVNTKLSRLITGGGLSDD